MTASGMHIAIGCKGLLAQRDDRIRYIYIRRIRETVACTLFWHAQEFSQALRAASTGDTVV